MYLNTVLTKMDDSFLIMREHFLNREDAARFIDTHFPLESSRLRGDKSKYQL